MVMAGDSSNSSACFPSSMHINRVFLAAEELVVHKAFASRERDWLDIDGICARQGTNLDIPLVLAELEPLATLKDDPDILPRLLRTFSRHSMDRHPDLTRKS